MPLRKTELARLIANDTGLTQKKSNEVLKVLMDTLTESLRRGDSVRIRGFGKLFLRNQKELKIRHPITGKSIIVGPKKIANFKSFKALQGTINYYDFDINVFNRENEVILQQLYELIENSRDYEGEMEEEKDTF
jgi:DNA-binding protein HU-beta